MKKLKLFLFLTILSIKSLYKPFSFIIKEFNEYSDMNFSFPSDMTEQIKMRYKKLLEYEEKKKNSNKKVSAFPVKLGEMYPDKEV